MENSQGISRENADGIDVIKSDNTRRILKMLTRQMDNEYEPLNHILNNM